MVEVRTQQSGRLEDVSPLDLLQSLGIYRRAGHVSFFHAHGHSRLWFEAGEIVDAESGALRGAAAVHRIVTHDRGEFRVEVTGEARGRTIEGSGSGLIFEAARRLDEGQRLRTRLPAAEAVLARAPGAAALDGPTEEHARLAAILEAGATLGEVLERSGLGELETLQWIARLVEAGRLRATGAVRSPGPLAGHGLAEPASWPLGLEPSQSFVPSPSYASDEGLGEVSGPRRRRWIHASVGAAVVAAIATLAIVRAGTEASADDADSFVTMAGAPVAVLDGPAASSVHAREAEPVEREPPLAVGAAETTQRSSGERAAQPASPSPSVSTTSRAKPSRANDPRARTRTEPEPAVRPAARTKPSGQTEDAASLLAQARRAYAAGQGETAYRLASRSQRIVSTGDAAELMTLAACQLQRPEAAAEALRAVPLLRRGSVRATCKQAHGVRIKLLPRQ